MRLLRLSGLFLLLMPLVFVQAVLADDTYDDTPAVVNRVARISFMSGDVQVRRSDSDEWEKATRDLPLVEGDQIATAPGARVELQLDSYNYVRLAENSLLTFNTLRDGQVALSLPEGTISVRILNFDRERNSFEIDAPQTTVAVQRAGLYRIDTGSKNSEDIRVTVTQEGQARIYSDNSGFTLKNGRTARIYLNGDYAGEPDINTAVRSADEWDSWVLERDAIIAKKLSDAYYDKYYDRDMYGVEDLNQYGDWVYTNRYGYVWRPHRSYTNSYSSWSPYRYGSWRWVPPYGWIWMGDEPWSWSTYHYGRWVYYGGGWAWTPYGEHRWRRSWWQPALVVISWSGPSICWYPLPYNYYYYNYNSHYYSSHHWNGGHHNNGGGHHNGGWNGGNNGGNGGNGGGNNGGNGGGNGGGGSGGGAGGGGNPNALGPGLIKVKNPPLQPTGPLDPAYTQAVTTVPSDGFGLIKSNIKPAPLALATLATKTGARQTLAGPVRLPDYSNTKVAADIKPDKQVQVAVRNDDVKGSPGVVTGGVKVGAAIREPGVKLDETLRKDRVFGGRPPVEKPPVESGGTGTGDNTVKNNGVRDAGIRGTGAVKRDDPPKDSGYVDTPRPQPRDNGYVDTPRPQPRTEEPVKSNDGGTKPRGGNNEPVREQPQPKPRYDPPPPPPEKPREEPRYVPPPKQEQPRYDPPKRNDPPPRSEPRSEPKPSSPPPRSEPKSEPSKPSSPPPSERKNKDG